MKVNSTVLCMALSLIGVGVGIADRDLGEVLAWILLLMWQWKVLGYEQKEKNNG